MQISNPRALVVSGGVWEEVGEQARSRIGKLERTSGERECKSERQEESNRMQEKD